MKVLPTLCVSYGLSINLYHIHVSPAQCQLLRAEIVGFILAFPKSHKAMGTVGDILKVTMANIYIALRLS